MKAKKKLKYTKQQLNILADLVTEDDIEDSFIVEILCRKLLLLGYLKLEDGFYRRSNGTETH